MITHEHRGCTIEITPTAEGKFAAAIIEEGLTPETYDEPFDSEEEALAKAKADIEDYEITLNEEGQEFAAEAAYQEALEEWNEEHADERDEAGREAYEEALAKWDEKHADERREYAKEAAERARQESA